MSSVNKVILVGRLGKDPEVRFNQGGQAICKFSVATSENWTDKQTGQKQEKTEWHNIVIFGKLAEIAGQYLKKGSQVYLEGKLTTSKYQDQNGQDRYSTNVQVSDMTMLGGGQNDGGGHAQNAQGAQNSHDAGGDFGGYNSAPQQRGNQGGGNQGGGYNGGNQGGGYNNGGNQGGNQGGNRQPAPQPAAPQNWDDDIPF